MSNDVEGLRPMPSLSKVRTPKPPLVNISSATQPMDLVHVDLVGMETTVSTSKKTSDTESLSGRRSLLALRTGV